MVWFTILKSSLKATSSYAIFNDSKISTFFTLGNFFSHPNQRLLYQLTIVVFTSTSFFRVDIYFVSNGLYRKILPEFVLRRQ